MTRPRFDRTHFDAMTGGDVGLGLEVLAIFRSQADMWGRLLSPSTDSQEWADASHTIKGAALGIGAFQLSDVCEIAEKRGRQGNVSPTEAAVLLSAVKTEIGQTLEVIAQIEFELTQQVSFGGSEERATS